jgi:hypothetical protein
VIFDQIRLDGTGRILDDLPPRLQRNYLGKLEAEGRHGFPLDQSRVASVRLAARAAAIATQ